MVFSWLIWILCIAVATSTHSAHVPERGETTPCERVAEAVPTLLTGGDAMFHLGPGDLEDMARSLVIVDVFDGGELERLVCAFEGVGTLSELLTVTDDTGMDYSAVKIAYDYFAFQFRFAKHLMTSEQNHYQFDRHAVSPEILDLVTDVEAFGLTGLDPAGVEAIAEIQAPNVDLREIEVEPFSQLPLEKQCQKLTHSIQKVWNLMIRTNGQYNPDVSQEYRALLKTWTGLEPENKDNTTALVCDLLECAHNEGLVGIYDWILDKQILKHTLKAAYPLMQKAVQKLQTNAEYALEMLVAVQSSPVNYSASLTGQESSGEGEDPSHDDGDDSMLAYRSWLVIEQNLQQVGLLSLRDDLK